MNANGPIESRNQMTNNVTSVKIGFGLGALPFGSSMTDVQAYLGVAQEVDESLQEEFPEITWEYADLGVDAYFSGEDDFRLGTLRIDNVEADVDGMFLMCKPKKVVIARLSKLELGKVHDEYYHFSDNPSLERIAFKSKGIEFW